MGEKSENQGYIVNFIMILTVVRKPEKRSLQHGEKTGKMGEPLPLPGRGEERTSMNRQLLAFAARATIPVMMGYLPLGAAFGLLMAAADYGPLWVVLMSVIIYAGSGQILGVSLLAAGASVGQTALLTLVLNFRQVVYGLSMLDKFRGMGWRKPYMISALTDETYALLTGATVPPGVDEHDFFFAVAALNHGYWILGSLLGSLMGALVGSIPQGVEFAMTALFLVIAVSQWKGTRDHVPALLGLGVTVVSRMIFGAKNSMLLGALAILVVVLALRRQSQRGEVQV